MKTLFFALFITLFTSTLLNAQDVPTNVVSCTVFDAVKFNGATIAQIENTEGELEAITALLGEPSSIQNHLGGMNTSTFTFGQNIISYSYAEQTKDHGTIPGKVNGLSIRDTNWDMQIQGVQLRVGMHHSEVEELLIGNGVLFDVNLAHTNSTGRGPRVHISITCDNQQDGFISISLNPNSLVITEIRFWRLT